MDKVEMLKIAYNAHKNEIMYRRKSEYFTAVGSMLMYGLLTVVLMILPASRPFFHSPGAKALATIMIILVADVQCYFFMKNHKRHCDLQRAVCSIDHAFSFFVPGEYLADEALYEESWKKSGVERPWGVMSRMLIVFCFAGVLLAVMWLKGA